MKRSISIIICSLFILTSLSTNLNAKQAVYRKESVEYNSSGEYYKSRESKLVADGVVYEKVVRLTKDGFLDLHLIKVSLDKENLGLGIVRSAKDWRLKEPLEEMVKESDSQILAAINGSFFNMSGTHSDPIGFEFDQGYYTSLPKYINPESDSIASLFYYNDKSAKIDFFSTEKFIIQADSGKLLYINTINQALEKDHPAVFTSYAYKDSSFLDKAGKFYKIAVKNNEVIKIYQPDQLVDLTNYDFIISMPQAIAHVHLPNFPVGEKANLIIKNTLPIGQLNMAISGGGMILKDGKLVRGGMMVAPDKRHPRTIIGLDKSKQTLILAVFDGRGSSIGATHNEIANYLLSEGVYDALYMDGGGSSIMMARELGHTKPIVQNQYSGKNPRKILNGLAVISTAKEGETAHLLLTSNKQKTFIGSPVTIDVKGLDENYLASKFNPANITWSVNGINGKLNGNTFIPEEAGKAIITAYYDNIEESISIEAVDQPSSLSISPTNLIANEPSQFTIMAITEDGESHPIPASNVSYALADESIGSFENGIFTPSIKGGFSKVIIQYGNISQIAYVYAGNSKKILDLENANFVNPSVADGNLFELYKVHEFGYDDFHSLEIDYDFALADSPDKNRSLSVGLDGSLKKIPEYSDIASISVYNSPKPLALNLTLVDSKDKTFDLNVFDSPNQSGWQVYKLNLPKDASYPISLKGIELINKSPQEKLSGSLYLDDLIYGQEASPSNLAESKNLFPSDSLMTASGDKPLLSIFGELNDKRLLNPIVAKKALSVLDESQNAYYFGGISSLKPGKNTLSHANHYYVKDYPNYRLINLATDKASIRANAPSQFALLNRDLVNCLQDNIVIISSSNPLSFKDKREADILHKMISSYKKTSGKNVYYVAKSSSTSSVNIKDGVRYISLDGVNAIRQANGELDLHNNFHTCDFYLIDGQLRYRLNSIYPLIN